MDTALAQLRTAMDTLAQVDASTLPEDRVTQVVRGLATLVGRADGLQARFVRAAEEADLPSRTGATSTTDWLSETTGRSRRESSRTGRMAKTLDEAPELTERLATGQIGPDQADRIARGLDRGTLDATDATDLLEHATHLPPGAFNREAKRLEGRRHQRRLREQELTAHDARSGSRWRQEDASLRLEFQVPPAEGDVVDKALNAFVQPDPAEVPDELRRSHRQLLADALVDMCRTVLQSGAAGEVGGVRPQVTVTISPEMMAAARHAEASGETAVTDLDTVLSAAAVQQLLCDPTFRRTVVDPDGQALDVGRATRKWPPAIRTAITALDGGDRTPGSDLPPSRCEIHHIEWWENGGGTSVENGVLLGTRGHSMIHVEGWTLEMDPVTRICTWTSPDGATSVTTYPRGAAARGQGAQHDIAALRGSAVASGAATEPATEPDEATRREGPGPMTTSANDPAAGIQRSPGPLRQPRGPDPGRAPPGRRAGRAPPQDGGAPAEPLRLTV